jgi:uncharacterized protein (DUF849 family)
MLLKAALNGNRTLQEHAHIPISPGQLAADAQAAVLRGVGAIHVHPRARNGAESLQKSDMEPVILAIHRYCPTIPIGVSTGEWIVPNLSARLKYVSEWTDIINFASVNFDEVGAVEVASTLLKLGIGVEAGLFHADAAETLAKSGLAEKCLRIMFEPGDETLGGAMQTVRGIEEVLTSYQIKNKSRLLHGFNLTAWPLLVEAKKRGYDTRIGFEDTLFLPNGEQAKNNSELIDAAKKLLTDET